MVSFLAFLLVVGLFSESSGYTNHEITDSVARFKSGQIYRSVGSEDTKNFVEPNLSAFTIQDSPEIVENSVTRPDELIAKIQILNEKFAKLKRSSSPIVKRSNDLSDVSEIVKSEERFINKRQLFGGDYDGGLRGHGGRYLEVDQLAGRIRELQRESALLQEELDLVERGNHHRGYLDQRGFNEPLDGVGHLRFNGNGYRGRGAF